MSGINLLEQLFQNGFGRGHGNPGQTIGGGTGAIGCIFNVNFSDTQGLFSNTEGITKQIPVLLGGNPKATNGFMARLFNSISEYGAQIKNTSMTEVMGVAEISAPMATPAVAGHGPAMHMDH